MQRRRIRRPRSAAGSPLAPPRPAAAPWWRRQAVARVQLAVRALILAGLGALVVAGLLWSLNPEDSGGLDFVTRPADHEADGPAAHRPADPAEVQPEPGEPGEPGGAQAEPGDEPDDDGPPEELIAAARDPAETTVQVLDAGGGPDRTDAVAALVQEFGYQVVNVTRSRTRVERTTVWYSQGEEPQGRALRARDRRFGLVSANERLHEGVNLHVLVGPDWR